MRRQKVLPILPWPAGLTTAATLGLGEVQVWWTELDLDLDYLPPPQDLLGPDEQARAQRLQLPQVRRRFVVARSRLRQILANYLGVAPQAVNFAYGPRGKPALAWPECGLEFNLAHSQGLAVYAVSRAGPVGIDLEGQRAMPEALELAERFFHPQEVSLIASHPPWEQGRVFLRLWTIKEAVLKGTGEGIGNLGAVIVEKSEGGWVTSTPWYVYPLAIHPDYVATLALEA